MIKREHTLSQLFPMSIMHLSGNNGERSLLTPDKLRQRCHHDGTVKHANDAPHHDDDQRQRAKDRQQQPAQPWEPARVHSSSP